MPMFSIPLSGLTASSMALSNIANNIANQNTVGYKETRTEFRDLFYQTLGSSGSGDPLQIGAGTAVGAIASDFTSGSVEQSGVPTDVAIMGDGFFVVQKDGVTQYTRAGDFSRDSSGMLVTSEGQQVMGYPASKGIVNTGMGVVPIDLSNGAISPANATTSVELRTNLDARATVDDPAFSTPVKIFDSLGDKHILTFTFAKVDANTWSYDISIPGADVGKTDPVSVKNGQLTFNGDGTLATPAADVADIGISKLANGASDVAFTWKIYDGGSATVTQMADTSNTSSAQQDGYGSGTLSNFDIQSDGSVMGTFSNGKTAVLAQLALANFANVQGLSRSGKNDFSDTLASGAPVVGIPGTGGRGTVSGGALELSNVDIASEFADLITAQRAFQANARTITTFDDIMQETINLKHD